MKGYKRILIPLFTVFWGLWSSPVTGQSQNSDLDCPIAVSEQFESGFQISTQTAKPEIVSARNPSQTEHTIPSLWWAVEQFDPLEGNLVTTWQANRTTQVIDIIVNQRSWQNLDNPYSFVHRMGSVARDYQYQLRVLNQQQNCLAIYICDFDTDPAKCNVNFSDIVSR